MATEPNPVEVQPQQPPPQFGGMAQIMPQEEGQPYAGGSHFQLSPEALQMLWAPQQQPLAPQQQIQPPQINPLM